MSSSEATAIIADASAVGSGVIVAVSNYAASLLQAREARRTELRRVAALDVSLAEAVEAEC